MIHQVKYADTCCANLRSQRCDTWSEFDSGVVRNSENARRRCTMATNDFGHVSLFDMCAGFFCRKDFCTKPRPMRQEKSIQTWTSSQVSKDHGGKGSHPGYSPCREISRLAKFVSVLCSAIRCWQGPDVFTRCVCIYIYIYITFLVFPSQLSYIQNFNRVAVGTKYTKYVAEH